MTTTSDRLHQRQLLQIAIGAAWADRHLEPAETTYLQALCHRYGFDNDPELQDLITVPVPVKQTEQWLVRYLQETSVSERQRALVAIANLFIADGEVADIEHELIDEFHILSDRIPPHPESHPESHPTDTIHRWLQKLGTWVRATISPIH